MIVGAEASHRLHMVGMVVRDEDVVHILKSQSIVMEMLFQRSDSHSNIYQYRIRLSVKIVTVAATSTAKGYESKHFYCYFTCKVTFPLFTRLYKFFLNICKTQELSYSSSIFTLGLDNEETSYFCPNLFRLLKAKQTLFRISINVYTRARWRLYQNFTLLLQPIPLPF